MSIDVNELQALASDEQETAVMAEPPQCTWTCSWTSL
ncbi:ALQxL family class IV lanthipeptide [Kitasatospora sp. NPDC008050]